MAKRKKRKRGWGGMGLVALILGGVAVAVGVVLLVLRGKQAGGPDGGSLPFAEMRYMPDEMQTLESRRVDVIRADPNYQKIAQYWRPGIQSGHEFWGHPPENVERIFATFGAGGEVVVMRLKASTTGPDVLRHSPQQLMSWSEEKVGKYTMHVGVSSWNVTVEGGGSSPSNNHRCFCVPEEKLVLFGQVNAMRPALQRKGGPALSPRMKQLLAAVDLDRPLVRLEAYREGSQGVDLTTRLPLSIEVRRHTTTNYVLGQAYQVDLSPRIVTTNTYLCRDAEAAQAVKKFIEDSTQTWVKKTGGDADELFASQTCTVNGSELVVRKEQSVDALLRWKAKRPGQGWLNTESLRGP